MGHIRRLALSGRFRMPACENWSYSQTCTFGAIPHAGMRELVLFADLHFRGDSACRHAKNTFVDSEKCKLFQTNSRMLACENQFRMPACENEFEIIYIFLDSIPPFKGPIKRLFENAPKLV
jgi:hypothetical protein